MDSQEFYPIITTDSKKNFVVEKIPYNEKEIADYFIGTLNAVATASKFNISMFSLETIFKRPLVKEYIGRKIMCQAKAAELTKDNLLAKLHDIIEGKVKISKSILGAIQVAAKILGHIKPAVHTAVQINVNPYSEKSDAELDSEMRKRLESSSHDNDKR